jgi:hypothetical protein
MAINFNFNFTDENGNNRTISLDRLKEIEKLSRGTPLHKVAEKAVLLAAQSVFADAAHRFRHTVGDLIAEIFSDIYGYRPGRFGFDEAKNLITYTQEPNTFRVGAPLTPGAAAAAIDIAVSVVCEMFPGMDAYDLDRLADTTKPLKRLADKLHMSAKGADPSLPSVRMGGMIERALTRGVDWAEPYRADKYLDPRGWLRRPDADWARKGYERGYDAWAEARERHRERYDPNYVRYAVCR